MKRLSLIRTFLFAAVFLLGAGCDGLFAQPVPTGMPSGDSAPPVESRPTFLSVIDPSKQLTADDLIERRHDIVGYLIENGYIYSGDDLVPRAVESEQIIRALLTPDGGFELTVYPHDPLSHRVLSFDLDGDPVYTCYPGDPEYNGDGINPFYISIMPLYAPFHERRDWRNDPDRGHRQHFLPPHPSPRPAGNHPVIPAASTPHGPASGVPPIPKEHNTKGGPISPVEQQGHHGDTPRPVAPSGPRHEEQKPGIAPPSGPHEHPTTIAPTPKEHVNSTPPQPRQEYQRAKPSPPPSHPMSVPTTRAPEPAPAKSTSSSKKDGSS